MDMSLTDNQHFSRLHAKGDHTKIKDSWIPNQHLFLKLAEKNPRLAWESVKTTHRSPHHCQYEYSRRRLIMQFSKNAVPRYFYLSLFKMVGQTLKNSFDFSTNSQHPTSRRVNLQLSTCLLREIGGI